MPTGYTYDVQAGKITELRDYALLCVGAFLIEAREGTLGDKLPDNSIADTSHHDKGVAEASARLAALAAMTPEETQAACDTAFAKKLTEHREWIKTKNEHRGRYVVMLDRVKAWQIPEACDGLKQFMVEQLDMSIKHDCGDWPGREPVKPTAAEWLVEERRHAQWAVDYHTKERAAQIARVNERNLWLDTVRVALAEIP